MTAVESIAKHLTDENARHDERIALLRAAAAIGPSAKDAIPAVTKLLGNRDTAIRLVAVETLGKIGAGNPEALAKLAELLKNHRKTPQALQEAALRALAGMKGGAKAAAGDLKEYREQIKIPSCKVWASATLVAIGQDVEQNAKIVLRALKDSTPRARSARIAAIEAAAYLGPQAKPGIPNLIEALKDKSLIGRADGGRVREQAAHTLGQLGATAKDAIKPLSDMLRDPDRKARRAAVEALGSMGPDAIVAAPRLRELARIDSEMAPIANAALDRIDPPKKMD